jgi:hypothetical protein
MTSVACEKGGGQPGLTRHALQTPKDMYYTQWRWYSSAVADCGVDTCGVGTAA